VRACERLARESRPERGLRLAPDAERHAAFDVASPEIARWSSTADDGVRDGDRAAANARPGGDPAVFTAPARAGTSRPTLTFGRGPATAPAPLPSDPEPPGFQFLDSLCR
jgi:hypothetical protein